MYILALNGSHNNDGNTAFLLNEILRHCAEKGAETVICSVSEAIMDTKTPFCVACSTPYTLFDKIERADFVVFGSPVYFGSMTGQMKCFFDKTRDARANKKWLGKPMAAVTVGASKYGGQERTLEHIHSCALVSGMTLIGNSSVSGMGQFGVSAQKPANEDTYAINPCKILAERIIETIREVYFFALWV